MAEAALKLNEQERLQEWQSMKAINTKQQREKKMGQVIPFRKREEVAPIGLEQALEAEEELSTEERFAAEQARATATQSSLGLSPAVEYLFANNNLSYAAREQALAQIQALTQQMRAAKTTADVRTIAWQVSRMNNDLVEEGLSEAERKAINEMRAWFWRFLEEGATATEDALLGADFGLSDVLVSAVNGFQIVYGIVLGNKPEPLNKLTLFFPPPLRAVPEPSESGAQGIYKMVMRIWDWLYVAFLWGIQNGWIIVIGLTAFILLASIAKCTTDILAAASDSMCKSLSSGLVDIIKVINQ